MKSKYEKSAVEAVMEERGITRKSALKWLDPAQNIYLLRVGEAVGDGVGNDFEQRMCA